MLSSFLCAFCSLISINSLTLGQDVPSAKSQEREKETPPKESADSITNGNNPDQASESKPDIVETVYDHVIEHLKQTGDSETPAGLKTVRDQHADDDKFSAFVGRCACELIRSSRKQSELLSARQLVPDALRVAETVKQQFPQILMFAHSEAACVDEDFEFYESALKHTSISRQVAEESNLEHEAFILRCNYAHILRKLKRFDEAEKIYAKLTTELTKNPKGFSDYNLLLFSTRFSLAITYGEKGAYSQYLKAFPVGAQNKQEGEDDDVFADRLELINAIAVNWAISEGKLDLAEPKAQRVVDWSQRYSGVSSRRHIEAIELLAKVRVAQKKPDEAVVLLKKCSDLRAGLFGKDHPSITRVQKEIDVIRKKQLDNAEPIWTPPADSETADRYGEAKPVDGEMK